MAATANAAIYCPECGEMRVNIFNSRYSVRPSGHGKLWPKLSRSAIAAAKMNQWVMQLPVATTRGRAFIIDGQPPESRWAIASRRMVKRAPPPETLGPGHVLARVKYDRGWRARCFKPANRAEKARNA